ncbi:pol protein [Chaetoceros tenuissimus]|uniref:Pol protein n=1 Tax=Chaetoceros tenuissimus TaxID=426638 RepID=A0AAD3H3T4_9STRA|nr:pol protein [Chaetoceros tenuissimus]
MLLVYVDNILAVSEVAEELVGVIGSKFKLKKSSVGRPSRYLGGGIEQVQTDDVGRPSRYLCGGIEQVQTDDGRIIWSANCIERGDGKHPFPSSYRPELDTSPELEDISKYQQYIGVLRWACELGRIDILTELGFDPARPDDVVSPLDGALISKIDWAEFYPDAEEQLPRRMPTPHGAAVLTRAYVDANHAGNLANRHSHTGILIYINNSPVLWYSKRQNTVETSSFGSEFVALCIAVEMVEALRYKLRCFGVPIDGPTEVLCDNRSGVTNSSVPASTLNKHHNAPTIKVLWVCSVRQPLLEILSGIL